MWPRTNLNEFSYVHMMNFTFERFFYHFTITTLRKAINSDYFDGVVVTISFWRKYPTDPDSNRLTLK